MNAILIKVYICKNDLTYQVVWLCANVLDKRSEIVSRAQV